MKMGILVYQGVAGIWVEFEFGAEAELDRDSRWQEDGDGDGDDGHLPLAGRPCGGRVGHGERVGAC